MISKGIRSELLINTGRETRVAVIENGRLQEVHIERVEHKGIVGNIYKGKVVRVLPGMQAAFVEIGLGRTGFLHVADVMPITEGIQSVDLNTPEADVRKWLYEGQEVLVQAIKDPVGSKGARLTVHLSIPSRFLVYMPDLGHVGVSLKLESEEERERLQKLMADVLGSKKASGYIVRTVAEGVSNEALKQDIAYLDKIWRAIEETGKKIKAPGLVHSDLPVTKRLLRDLATNDLERVLVDNEILCDALQAFTVNFVPGVKIKIEYYDGKSPIFDMYGIEDELQKALRREVSLKSGGYLVFDQTEAMTTIDVNTGAFVGNRNLEETIFKTNLEAARSVAHQLRLRNIGGIIIIDFIDMTDQEHKDQVYATLEAALARDTGGVCIGNFTELGLLQMTRKRMRESLWQVMCEACPQCQGRSKIKTVQTITYDIFREITREAIMYPNAAGFLILASSQVIDFILDMESEGVADLEAQLGNPIKLQADANFSQEYYELILM